MKLRPIGPVFLLLLCAAGTFAAAAVRAEDAGAAYAQAESLIREHQWDQGLAILKQLLKTHPNDTMTLNLTGLAFTGKGDPAQADVYFRAALKVNPRFVPALKNLAINEVGLKDFKDAQRHLLLASAQSPNDPVIDLYLGETYYRQQDYRRAAAEFSRGRDWLSRNSQMAAELAISDLKIGDKDSALSTLNLVRTAEVDPPTQFLLGVSLSQSGLNAQAIPYFEAVRLRYPSSYEIGFDLAICHLAAKEYPQTISIARSLIDNGHESAELDNLLAEAYVDDKQPQPAVEALRRAIALDPDDDENYLDFASLCMNNHAYNDASRVLDVGLRVHPKSSRLIFERGILNAMQDHYDLAEKDFEESSALEPEKNAGYIGLGVTYIETGKSAQAIPLLRKRLAEKPNDANLLYLLGEALVRSGAGPGDKTFVEAQTSLEKSVRLNPNLCLPHVALGNIYLQENRTEDAVRQFEQARLIDPAEKSAYSHLAIAYRRLGQADKAKEMVSFLKDINDQERAGSNQRVKSMDGLSNTPAHPDLN